LGSSGCSRATGGSQTNRIYEENCLNKIINCSSMAIKSELK